jgi:hypothetical protein
MVEDVSFRLTAEEFKEAERLQVLLGLDTLAKACLGKNK